MKPSEFVFPRSGHHETWRAEEIWASVAKSRALPNLGCGYAFDFTAAQWRAANFFAFRRASGILTAVGWMMRADAAQDGAGDFEGTSWQLGRPHSTLILTASPADALDLFRRYSLPVWASGFRGTDQLGALDSVDLPDSVDRLIIAGRKRQDLEMGEAALRHSDRAEIEYLWLDEGEERNGRGT